MHTGLAFLPADRQRDGVFEGLVSAQEPHRCHDQAQPGDGAFTIGANVAGAQALDPPISSSTTRRQPADRDALGRQSAKGTARALGLPATFATHARGSNTRRGRRSPKRHLAACSPCRAQSDGLTIIVTSSDVEELATFCDRVVVFRAGHDTSELESDELNAAAITNAMYHTDTAESAA